MLSQNKWRNVHHVQVTVDSSRRESLLLSRLDPRERGPSVNSIFQRVRDKGRSLPQAPPPAVAGCHPRHFDIDEGNLREHCWRRRLMRRVRARAPREAPGPSRTHRATTSHRFLHHSFSLSIALPATWWIAFRHPTNGPANDCPARLLRHSTYYCRAWNCRHFRVIAIKWRRWAILFSLFFYMRKSMTLDQHFLAKWIGMLSCNRNRMDFIAIFWC